MLIDLVAGFGIYADEIRVLCKWMELIFIVEVCVGICI